MTVAVTVIPTEQRIVLGFADVLISEESLTRKYLVCEEGSLDRLNWSVSGVSFVRRMRERRDFLGAAACGFGVGRSGKKLMTMAG